jgi:hypothetical protein
MPKHLQQYHQYEQQQQQQPAATHVTLKGHVKKAGKPAPSIFHTPPRSSTSHSGYLL